eukprot:32659-Pelagomonas_calceolata.AAC.1
MGVVTIAGRVGCALFVLEGFIVGSRRQLGVLRRRRPVISVIWKNHKFVDKTIGLSVLVLGGTKDILRTSLRKIERACVI